MKEGLIAFLGFLAAALVQVMPVTANFLQSDKLTFAEAKRLTASLTRQQNYWVGLLTATLAAMVLVILGAALNSRAPTWKASFEHQLFTNISWEAVIVFFCGFECWFCHDQDAWIVQWNVVIASTASGASFD